MDPMTIGGSRSGAGDKTICLAVSPALKAMGVKNRCRVFEIPPGIDYIMAEPRMQKYIDYSAEIYGIYLRYISKDDIHVYSVDEAFLDVSPYLSAYGMTARETGKMLMKEIRKELGIRATCGIGTNLYLTKIALDILAKHAPDFFGELDGDSYQEQLWNHRPLTDFGGLGEDGFKLQNIGIDTMKAGPTDGLSVFHFSVSMPNFCTIMPGAENRLRMQDIKNYRAETTSRTSGQVLMRDYSYEEGKLILKEMVDQLCLQLTKDHQKDSIHDCVHRVFQQVAGTACTGGCFSFRAHRFFRKVDCGNDSGYTKVVNPGHSHSAIQHLLQSPAIRRIVYPVNVG